MTQLYLVRHGQTDWNVEGRYQGQTDLPLNAAGRAQAERLSQELSQILFTAVYSSDLMRARVTAEILAAPTGLAVRLDRRLREINLASLYDLFKGAERVLNMARAFNLREGLRRSDDTLPKRFFEPLEGGRLQGRSMNREDFDRALTWYYQMRGWDVATGLPTRGGKLADLDLNWLAEELGVD